MKSILIEDRIKRQQNQLGIRYDEFINMPFLNNIAGGQSFVDIQSKLNNKEYSVLEEYEVIMLHRSAFDTNTRNGLIEYFKKTYKKVVFFSGGISGCQINKIGSLEFLLINVNQFYSENLFLFLHNDSQNLLELAFGNKWQISILMDTYEKLVLYSKSINNRQPYAKVEEDLKLNDWIKKYYFIELQQKNLIEKIDLLRVLETIKPEIEKIL